MTPSDYIADFKIGWRPLAATSLGLSSGIALFPFVINVLAPHLVTAMGWTKAQFALTAMVSGLAILSYPIVGVLADRFGVRRIGGIGVLATSLSYVAIAMLDGAIGHYVAILILQLTLGAMTTGPVFLRLVIGAFDRSRGIALALAVSSPAIVAALASSLFAALIEAKGWRFASLTLAGYALSSGLVALALIPRGYGREAAPHSQSGVSKPAIRGLFAKRQYRILLAVTMLVSMPLAVTNSQLALVLIENGMTLEAAGSIMALFAAGTIAGRLLAGLALDRYSAEKVGAFAFSLSAVGMVLLAAPSDQPALLAAAVVLLGLAFGAEGDILAYIASHIFGPDHFGAALGTLFAAVGASSMLGAIALSQSLSLLGSYTGFLLFGSVSVLLGSALLLSLRNFTLPPNPVSPAP